MNYTKV